MEDRLHIVGLDGDDQILDWRESQKIATHGTILVE